MAGNVKVFLLVFFHQIVCTSGQSFSVESSNFTINEGGNANFSCTFSSGGAVQWSIRSGSTQLAFIQGNQSDISGLDLGEALILGPLGSPLLLVNISQSMNGLAVVCTTEINFSLQDQPRPFSYLDVRPLSSATCDSGEIQVQVNLEETPVRLSSNIRGNPDMVTIKCMVVGGSEFPGSTAMIDLSDNTPLMWDRADFTNIDIYARTIQVTCAVFNAKGSCSSNLRLAVSYDAAPCGDVSGCLATVVVVVLVVGIALAVGITVAVVVVVKKMCLN